MHAGVTKCGIKCTNDVGHSELKIKPLQLGGMPVPDVDEYYYLGILSEYFGSPV